MEVALSTDTEGLEQALDALLTAMAEDEAKRSETTLGLVMVKPAHLSGPVPTRSEMELAQILREPVYFACRMAVRRLGERTFTITGSTDGMRDVADRVAGQMPAQFGRRLSVLNSAWDGVGSDSDRWWA